MLDNIKDMKVGGQRHCGWQGQPGGEDQGGSLQIECITSVEFSSTRISYAVVMGADMKFFILSTCLTI